MWLRCRDLQEDLISSKSHLDWQIPLTGGWCELLDNNNTKNNIKENNIKGLSDNDDYDKLPLPFNEFCPKLYPETTQHQRSTKE